MSNRKVVPSTAAHLFEVVDGRFAAGVPEVLEPPCQTAATRRTGILLVPFLAFFLPLLVIGSF